MRIFRLLGLTLLLACGCGCMKRAPQAKGVDLNVPIQCLTSDPVLKGCDASQSPPKCKNVKISYKAGCEALVIRK